MASGIYGTAALFFGDGAAATPSTEPKNSSWADGTQRLIPTARMARFVYDGKTIDLPDPLTAILYEDTPIVGANTVASGKREVLWERDEEVCVITTEPAIPEVHSRIRRMLKEWAGHGEQVEVYIDRQLRAYWGFEDDAYDNNRGNPFRSSEPATFTDLVRGGGINLPATGVLQAHLVSQLEGGSGNGFFQAGDGTLVFYFKPAFAGNDGLEHVLIDCVVDSNHGKNRLLIKKRVDNALHVIGYGANGAATVRTQNVAWAADTEHTMMVQWGDSTADFRASLDGAEITTSAAFYRYGNSRKYGSSTKYGQVASASPVGNEQIFDANPTTICLGSDVTMTMRRSTGVMGALSLYSVSYGLPTILGRFAHPHRTYYPKGEFIDATFRPVRVAAGGELYYYTMRIRDGR